MANKALITWREGIPPDTSAEISETVVPGFTIEEETPRGSLVSVKDEKQAADLEAMGYRVEFLPDTNILKVGDYTIDIEKDPTEAFKVPDELEVPKPLVDRWPHHIVQLKLPPSEEEIGSIEKLGLEVVEPISDYGLFVVGEPGRVKSLEGAVRSVAWTVPFKPAYRINSDLLNSEGTIRYLSIGVYPPDKVPDVILTLDKVGAKIVSRYDPPPSYVHDYSNIIVEVDARHLRELARLPVVRWLEFASSEPGLDGEREAQIVAGNLNGANVPQPGYQAWLAAQGLSGKGVVIAICDTGISMNQVNDTQGHIDIRGRQVEFVDYAITRVSALSDLADGHGTLVAAIAFGNAATNKKDGLAGEDCGEGDAFLCGQGVAPEAKYVNQNALKGPWPPGDFGKLTFDAVTNGAHIMNNSWNDIGNSPQFLGVGYTVNARIFDQLVRDPIRDPTALDKLILVFSAGNKGPFPRTITTPHEAKNIIVVGSSRTFLPGVGADDDIRGVNNHSSRGPAHDGRFLPNIVAPGNNVSGARAGTDDIHIRSASGTSLSAALVSGACALILEWWRENISEKNPSPAMMKALLINGAEDIAEGLDGNSGNKVGHIPNNVQGWGRINLANIINRGPKLFFDQEQPFTATTQEQKIRVEPVHTSRPMRVTLVWTDAPGAQKASRALVNNLDLEIKDASGAIFKGNVFDSQTGFSTTGGPADSLNNIECVYIESPSGPYDIVVRAQSLAGEARPPFSNTPWQDFAMVIDNAKRLP